MWKWHTFTLSFEINSDMHSFPYVYKKRFAQNGVGSIPTGMPIFCLISLYKDNTYISSIYICNTYIYYDSGGFLTSSVTYCTNILKTSLKDHHSIC